MIYDDYRMLFSSQLGRVVLVDMLKDLGFFDEVVADPDHLVLQNYARRLLKKCAILRDVNVKLFVDELFNKSIPYKEEGEC